ncbi:MAG TPA: hypothetical protein PLB32_07930 [Acidobacteriota bacterium]|nr:hypothetical protein [Acidobacteriota bacterium]
MLAYATFESNGFSFDYPAAWRLERQPGFEIAVCGPSLMRVYFGVELFPDRAQLPSTNLSPLHLLAKLHDEAPEEIYGERTQLGEIHGLAARALFIREGDPFESRLVAVRCLQGTGYARACLGVVCPVTLLEPAGDVIQQILDSLALEKNPWLKMRMLPSAKTTPIDFTEEMRNAPTIFLVPPRGISTPLPPRMEETGTRALISSSSEDFGLAPPLPETSDRLLTVPQPAQAILAGDLPKPAPIGKQDLSSLVSTKLLADAMLGDDDDEEDQEDNDEPTSQPHVAAATVEPSSYIVGTLTGGGAGFRDGPAALASFQRPNGITADPQGNLYVADFGNHRIRRISPEGITTTLAGSTSGFRDEPGSLAMFNGPRGIVYSNGYLYVADLHNLRIRRVTLNGMVKTFVGSGNRGLSDGLSLQAEFDAPRAVAADTNGNIFVADGVRIRRVTPDGKVQTIAGSEAGYQDGPIHKARFETLGSISLDAAGNIYVADVGNGVIRKITRDGLVMTLPVGPVAQVGSPIFEPVSVLALPDGTLYIADAEDYSIKCMFPDGSVAILAGNGRQGNHDGLGGQEEGCAEFWSPTGLALAKNMLFVTDRDMHVIRSIRFPSTSTGMPVEPPVEITAPVGTMGRSVTPPNNAFLSGGYQVPLTPSSGLPALQVADFQVPISREPQEYTFSTLAGSEVGFRDGSGEAVRFNCPMGVCVDAAGTVYVADHFNHCIRGVTTEGTVLTLAGSLESGLRDDAGTRACFKGPLDLAVGSDGALYVTDHLNYCVRLVTPKGEVRTLAGNGTQGSRDGQGRSAQFEGPKGIAVSSTGKVYVADGTLIRCIDPDGTVTTLAGSERGFRDGRGTDAAFGWPYAIALDAEDNCYVADAANHAIRRVTPEGTVTTLWGGPSLKFLNFPSGIVVDLTGVIYVSDTNNHRILRLDPNSDRTGVTASLIGGTKQGKRNGRGTEAELSGPRGICIAPNGDLFVADSVSHRIVKIRTSVTSIATPQPGPLAVVAVEPTPTAEVNRLASGPNQPQISDSTPVPIRPTSPRLPALPDEPVPTSSGNSFPTWDAPPELNSPPPVLMINQEVPSFTSDAVPRSVRDLAERMERQDKRPEGSPPPVVSLGKPPSGHVQSIKERGAAPPIVISEPAPPTPVPPPTIVATPLPPVDATEPTGETSTPSIPVPVIVPIAAPAPPAGPRQRQATQMFGWGMELTGHMTIRTEPDGALYVNTCQDLKSSAFFFHPWEAVADKKVVVEIRMQLLSYVGDRGHTGCAIWVENDHHADALLVQPEGISLLRATDLQHSCNTMSEPHTYTIIMEGKNILVLLDGKMCLNGINRFWVRPRAKGGENRVVRRWLAFGDGSSEAGSESRWHFVRYYITHSTE